ncbi:MAG: arylsulfatase A-like enzyme [Myxococcota bacterium]|jgi:arylsulfatase A-like enzyme
MILLVLACNHQPPLSRTDAPDVVILTVDTLRHDRLGATGHPTAHTPNIDALAARGVTFTQATTPFPRTTPALASMLTGLLPHRHGSREVGQPMTADRSIAALLTERGYTALGLSATRVAGPEQGLDVGFKRLEVHHDARGSDLSAAALSLIDAQADPDRPLLLWVHYADPHFPYLPPDAVESPCQKLGEKAASGKLKRVDLFTDHDGIASAALPSCSMLYDGEITATDAGIGALLSGLTERGRDGGLVILSSDHGEHFGEDGIFYEHGPSLHDAALRIPLIVAGPGVIAHTDDGVARLEDVAPTVLAAGGVAESLWPTMDGAALTDRLAGALPDPDAVAVSESGSALHVRFFSQLRSGQADRRSCLNDPPYSLCARPDEAPALYNHIDDRLLKSPLTDPATHARLTQAAAHWPPEQARHRAARTATHKRTESPRLVGGYSAILTTHDGVAVVDPTISSRLASALSPLPAVESGERTMEDEEALRALGYIE